MFSFHTRSIDWTEFREKEKHAFIISSYDIKLKSMFVYLLYLRLNWYVFHRVYQAKKDKKVTWVNQRLMYSKPLRYFIFSLFLSLPFIFFPPIHNDKSINYLIDEEQPHMYTPHVHYYYCYLEFIDKISRFSFKTRSHIVSSLKIFCVRYLFLLFFFSQSWRVYFFSSSTSMIK